MTETEILVPMSEPEIPFGLVLYLLCEFFVGGIVGASVAKDQESWGRGMAITMALGLAVIVYGIVLATLIVPRFPIEGLPVVLSVVLAVVSTLLLGFCPVLIGLSVATAGYWSAFAIFRRLGIGPNRITLPSVFAFVTILAVIAALIRLGPRP